MGTNDALDAAIAAAADPPRVPMISIEIHLEQTTGRTVVVTVPADLAALEVLELVSWIPFGLANALRQANGPSSRIVGLDGRPL